MANQEPDDKEKNIHVRRGARAFFIHRAVTFGLYVAGLLIALAVFAQLAGESDLLAILTLGAVLATLGAAIATLGRVWESDKLERVKLDVSILYEEIVEGDAWRRWPFLKRHGKSKLFNKVLLEMPLHNPKIAIDVGTHKLDIQLPTVRDDFFDLPMLSNVVNLLRFRRAQHTTYNRRLEEAENDEAKDNATQQLMLFECLYDIWVSVLVFRAARCATHFGCAVVFSAVALVVWRWVWL